MSDVKTASLSLATEDYDIFGEDLTFLISPKLSVRSEQSNHSADSSTSNIKVSPIVTDDKQLGATRPALGSLRGYDEHNIPVYMSSQTPHDYQVMTKRKTSKKSIFNFEGIDMKPEPVSSSTDHSSHQNPHQFGFTSQLPSPSKTGTEGIAYTKVDIYVKQEPTVESLDDSKFTFDLTESVPQFLEGINWNSQNSAMNDDGGGPMLSFQRQNSTRQPLALEVNDEVSKNPRKKQLGVNPDSTNNFQPSNLMVFSEPPVTNVTYQHPQYPAEHNQQRWNSNASIPQSQQTVFNPTYMELPSIRTLQENSQHLSQFTFPTPIITSTPPTSTSTNYDYEAFSNFSSPDHHSVPSVRVNSHAHHIDGASNIHDLQSNYHAILQQKVEAMKLSQSPNASEALKHRQLREHKQNQQQQQHFEEDNSKAKNRASKSLAEISRRFVTLYGKDNTMDYISGLVDPDITSEPQNVLNRVDGAAESLGVHVRRIYELIKILEILSLVTFAGDKRGKFSWRGTKDFLYTLGSIQNDGLTRFPQISTEIGLHDIALDDETPQNQNFHVSESKEDFLLSAASVDGDDLNESSWHDLNQLLNETSLFEIDNQQTLDLMNEVDDAGHTRQQPLVKTKTNAPPLKLKQPDVTISPTKIPALPVSPSISNEEHFMVEIICKRFLQLFLVGMNHLSMSHVIQKLIPMVKNQTLSEYNKVNATKIRRVYDVTNVLCSLNLIQKKSIPKSKALKAELFNNMDDITNSQQNSPFPTSDPDSPDFDDDSKASGSKKSTKSARSSSERGEAKVLEWSSFLPHIIRLKYLERKRAILVQQQQQQQQK